MKYRFGFFILLSLIYFNIFAQTHQNSYFEINWKGVVNWSADSSSLKVISFDGALHPSDNYLPYFTHQIQCDEGFSYSAQLQNPVFEFASNEEIQLLSKHVFEYEPILETNLSSSRNANVFEIRILPFVTREGKVLKVKSFELLVNKIPIDKKKISGTLHTYASKSVLSQGRFVKLSVSNSGVYKLTHSELRAVGIDPANVRVFGYGGAVLSNNFLLTKPDDLPELAIFRANDYILFYAQGINRWTYDKSNSFFSHISNTYSKYGYYFITSDAGVGRSIQEKSIVPTAGSTVNRIDEFVDYQVYEKDNVSLLNSGKEFFGEKFDEKIAYDFPFSFPNPILNNNVKIKLDVAVASTSPTSFTLKLNNTQAKQLNVSAMYADNYTKGSGASQLFTSITPVNESFLVNLTYNKQSSNAQGYLNFLELNVRRQLKMSGAEMQFQNVDFLGASSFNEYVISGANSNIQIWDITDQINVSKIKTSTENSLISFIDASKDLKNYLAIDISGSFPKPEIVGEVANQDLHAIAQADMVIIAHPNFIVQSEMLAQAHREKDNLTVSVVTPEQIYNEFSSGTPDASAYRWFMKMLYDRAKVSNVSADFPKYLLLFGRGSFDNRKILPNSGDNLILTYQAENSFVITSSYVTDDYYGLLDDNEGIPSSSGLSGSLDIGIGRFPVVSAQQATDVVKKTINYMNNNLKGNWKNQLCFLADDGDGALHMSQSNGLADFVTQLNPGYQVNKIFLDAFKQETNASGETYPLAKNRLLNSIRSGLLMLNYTGHGGPNSLTGELVINLNDVKSLTNKHLPIWVAATCDFLVFDQQSTSAGEHVVLNPNGGGIGILSAARPVYASQNLVLNKLFCENLFDPKQQNMRIGDVLTSAKNKIGTEINKLSYFYLGDPAVKINFPTEYKVITTNFNENSTLGNDTLRALSTVKISGYIANQNGDTLTDFNGLVHTVLYDKIQNVKTLNNNGEGSINYSERSNMLFSGSSSVSKGKFSFTIMLPKDIRYNYGGGRLNYYAQDAENNFEAQGSLENFIVGGINTNYTADEVGPQASLYLNTDKFVSGEKVNETPFFIAQVKDDNGVNTVGSGIGHDITVIIDGDPNQTYILNEYYQSLSNSYKEGIVRYKLPELKSGKHNLTFKVWDLLNNSSTHELAFEVVKGLTPELYTVSCYPNPAKSGTKFVINHDRPEIVLNTTVEIFDLSGRKIWSFSQSTADNVSWDLNTTNNTRVKSGIYIYRISVKTSNSDVISKSNKIHVIEQ